MSNESWKTVWNIAIFAGTALAAIGGLGTFVTSERIKKEEINKNSRTNALKSEKSRVGRSETKKKKGK